MHVQTLLETGFQQGLFFRLITHRKLGPFWIPLIFECSFELLIPVSGISLDPNGFKGELLLPLVMLLLDRPLYKSDKRPIACDCFPIHTCLVTRGRPKGREEGFPIPAN